MNVCRLTMALSSPTAFPNSKRDLSTLFEAAARPGIRHKLMRPYTPRRNGKAEHSRREDQKRLYSAHRFYSLAKTVQTTDR